MVWEGSKPFLEKMKPKMRSGRLIEIKGMKEAHLGGWSWDGEGVIPGRGTETQRQTQRLSGENGVRSQTESTHTRIAGERL